MAVTHCNSAFSGDLELTTAFGSCKLFCHCKYSGDHYIEERLDQTKGRRQAKTQHMPNQIYRICPATLYSQLNNQCISLQSFWLTLNIQELWTLGCFLQYKVPWLKHLNVKPLLGSELSRIENNVNVPSFARLFIGHKVFTFHGHCSMSRMSNSQKLQFRTEYSLSSHWVLLSRE